MEPKNTWLYLSGENANQIADCFSSGPLETKNNWHEIGKASALKHVATRLIQKGQLPCFAQFLEPLNLIKEYAKNCTNNGIWTNQVFRTGKSESYSRDSKGLAI